MALTRNDWKAIVADMDQQVQMLTEDEIQRLAAWLNERINIPVIGEEREERILAKVIRKVDRFLYSQLPNEYYELIRFAEDGISDEEADIIRVRLATLINRHVNIPFLSEEAEQRLFELLLGVLIRALRRGSNLETETA